MQNMLQLKIEAIVNKLKAIRQNHLVVSSVDKINDLSINYTQIPLKKEAKAVRMYYSNDAVSVYKHMLTQYIAAVKDNTLDINAIHTTIIKYVNGWAVLKELTPENVNNLESMIQYRIDKLKKYIEDFEAMYNSFSELNKDDTELVDSAYIPLYKYSKEFPYRKAYQHFFKKMYVSDDQIQNHLKMDNRILDELIDAMNLLYSGYDKTGKGDDYENFRYIRNRMIDIIQLFSTQVELDIHLYEDYSKLNSLIINFKLYPAK